MAGAPYQQAAQQATEALNAEYDVLNKRLWDAATPKAAHDAIKARMADIDDKLRPVPGMVAGPTTQHAALPNFHTVVPRQLYMSTGVDELWYTRGREVFDALSDSLEVLARKKPLRFGNMTPDVQNMLRANIEGLKGKMADARFASTRFGEYVRDSALQLQHLAGRDLPLRVLVHPVGDEVGTAFSRPTSDAIHLPANTPLP